MTVPSPRAALPGGGAPMETADYLAFLETEYLVGYVSRGGSAVKLLVTGDDSVARDLAEGLAALGGAEEYLHVAVDAAATRVHMVDQVFAAVARQVDWVALAELIVRRAYDRAGFPPPDKNEVGGFDSLPQDGDGDAGRTPELSVAAVAAYHEVDATELYRSVRRTLERAVLDDVALSHEFRVAMFRLCQEPLGRGDVTPAEREAVLGWLRGEKIPAAQLRKVGLFTKVARHNARPLLVSLSRWVRRTGRSGLVLQIDLERLAIARRPPAGLRDGHYYSKAAALDAYEVLRQLIDATDELEGLLLTVLMPPDLVTDEVRGLPAYAALQLRVADEVRDRRRPNPYAALMRLGVRLEAVR